MKLKYETNEDDCLIYDTDNSIIIISKTDKEDFLKEMDILNNMNNDLQEKRLVCKQLEKRRKIGANMVVGGAILTSICLLFNNPLNLGVIALSLTGVSLVVCLSAEDQIINEKNQIKLLNDKKKVLEEKIKTRYVENHQMELNKNYDYPSARFIKEVSDCKSKKALNARIKFVPLSIKNEWEENQNNYKMKVKRLVKHK